jgi:enoyl-CoA hydratase/carnithine racemase
MNNAQYDFEALTVEVMTGVAWVTIDRPDVLNSLSRRAFKEFKDLWQRLRHDDEVRCVVVTGAGDRAFCTGVDRKEFLDAKVQHDDGLHFGAVDSGSFSYDDLGDFIGPKSNDLWIPVIAAVNGMACGGAFYLLGEVDFIIASEDATFFDPHVTYGLVAAFEPIHMLQKMPFHEIMRLSLLGNSERMSAHRAYEIGLVSEVTAKDTLREQARWAAQAIADAPPLAVQGTVRAIWLARELSRQQALSMAVSIVGLSNDPRNMEQGQQAFVAKERPAWRSR